MGSRFVSYLPLIALSSKSRCSITGASHPSLVTYLTTPPQNLHLLYTKHITLYGFTVMILGEKYLDEFLTEIPPQLASGGLQHMEDLTYGLDKVGDAILAVQKGDNWGKAVVVVAEE